MWIARFRRLIIALLAFAVFPGGPAGAEAPGPNNAPTTFSDPDDDESDDTCWWLPTVPVGRPSLLELFSGAPVPVAAALPQLPSIPTTIAGATPLTAPVPGRTDPWAPPQFKQDGLKQVASATSATDFANLSAQVKLRERDAFLEPAARNAWETDQTVKVPVASSLFLFNQVTGSTPAVEQQQYKWLTKTGVGMKLKPWVLQEVQLRTGPAVRFDDTGTLTKGQSPEHPELFMEAVTKLPIPVVGPVNLEYTSYAVPATAADRNQINQDFKLALPFAGGQFHVGAKYKWESATATPWMDRMEVYFGLQNKW
jgi:hypothetical protein